MSASTWVAKVGGGLDGLPLLVVGDLVVFLRRMPCDVLGGLPNLIVGDLLYGDDLLDLEVLIDGLVVFWNGWTYLVSYFLGTLYIYALQNINKKYIHTKMKKKIG